MKRLLTMIQQLYINSATDSNNTRKQTQNLILAFARVSRLSCGWFVLYVAEGLITIKQSSKIQPLDFNCLQKLHPSKICTHTVDIWHIAGENVWQRESL